jgi:membrane protein
MSTGRRATVDPGYGSTATAVRAVVRLWVGVFARNNVLTYASAIALQLLVAVAALIFLAAASLHPLGADRTWTATVVPGLAAHLPRRWLRAVVWSVDREMSSSTAGLIVFGATLAVWEVSGAVRAVMGALNAIYDVREHRGVLRRFATSIALAAVVSVLLLVAGLTGAGAFEIGNTLVDTVERWLVPAAMIYLTVALLVLIAPARRQPWRWVSAGSLVIVIGWLGVSAGFAWWVTHVVDARSPEGALGLILSTVGYLYGSAITFLVGTQVDQLARRGGWSAVFGAGER